MLYTCSTSRGLILADIQTTDAVGAEHWTCDQQGAGSTLTWSTASNIEQVANLQCAQAISAS